MKHSFLFAAAAALICLTAAGCSGSSSGSPEPASTAPSSAPAPADTTDAPAELTLTASGTVQQFGKDDTPFTDALLSTLLKRHFTAEYEIFSQGELIGKSLIEVSGDSLHLVRERIPSSIQESYFGVQDSENLFIGAESYSKKDGEWVKETWRSPYFSGVDPTGSAMIGLFFYYGSLTSSDLTVKSRDEAADGSVTETFVVNRNDVLSVTYDAAGKPVSSEYGMTAIRFTKFSEEVGELSAPQITEKSGTTAPQ